MSFWSRVGVGAWLGTAAVGQIITKGGVTAIKEGFKLYKDYQKDPNINLGSRILNSTGKCISVTAVAMGKTLKEGYDYISEDIKREREEEERRLEEERREEEREAERERIEEEIKQREYKQLHDPIEYIRSKIVGVMFNNRQENIKKLKIGQYLRVVREKNNPHDKNAIALYNGVDDLGHLSKEVAASIAPILDRGKAVNVQVTAITGGGELNTGVNIKIEYEGASYAPSYYRDNYDDDYNNPDNWDPDDWWDHHGTMEPEARYDPDPDEDWLY